MKVVLDTNVLISAIMFGGKSRTILEMAVSGKIRIALSQDILKEFEEVLVRRKFHMSVAIVQQVVHELSEISELTIIRQKLNIIKSDPDDNRILECAMSAQADYIVSGDSDLLLLKKFKKLKILSPHDFLLELNK